MKNVLIDLEKIDKSNLKAGVLKSVLLQNDALKCVSRSRVYSIFAICA